MNDPASSEAAVLASLGARGATPGGLTSDIRLPPERRLRAGKVEKARSGFEPLYEALQASA